MNNNFQFSNQFEDTSELMNIDQTKKVISGYSYFLREKIGRGSSSEVFRGTCQKTSEIVAIKVLSLANVKKESAYQAASAEIDLLRKLKDLENIIQIRNAIQTKNNVYIITELCQDGNLETSIHKKKRYDEQTAVHIIQQIIKGYIQVARRGVIHRDLKPSNILKKGNTFKIGDFGYAIEAKLCGQPLKDNVGSPLYMPLQSLQRNLYSYKSDIWAIGIIFIQLLTGKAPWKAKTEKELIHQLSLFQLDNITPKNISAVSKKIIEKTLAKDIEARMSIEELMRWNFKQEVFEMNDEMASTPNLRIVIKPPSLRTTIGCPQDAKALKNLCKNVSLKNTSLSKHPSALSSSIQMAESEVMKSSLQMPTRTERSQISSKNTLLSTKMQTIANVSQKKQRNQSQDISLPLFQISKGGLGMRAKSESINDESTNSILTQVQGQINYFRYLLRILKKLNDYLRTKDSKIIELKHNLLSLIYQKMAEIKQLKYIKGANSIQKEAFMKSKHYLSIENIISKYRDRCKEEMSKFDLKIVLKNERQFINILSYAMNLIYSNILQVKANEEQLERKKALVFILEDLILLSKLFLLEREEHWTNFRNKSGISDHLLKPLPKTISLDYLAVVESKFLELSRS